VVSPFGQPTPVAGAGRSGRWGRALNAGAGVDYAVMVAATPLCHGGASASTRFEYW